MNRLINVTLKCIKQNEIIGGLWCYFMNVPAKLNLLSKTEFKNIIQTEYPLLKSSQPSIKIVFFLCVCFGLKHWHKFNHSCDCLKVLTVLSNWIRRWISTSKVNYSVVEFHAFLSSFAFSNCCQKWLGRKRHSWKILDEITVWLTEFHPVFSHMSDNFTC